MDDLNELLEKLDKAIEQLHYYCVDEYDGSEYVKVINKLWTRRIAIQGLEDALTYKI